MLKYTIWKSYPNNDMEEITSTDLLSEVARVWHDYSTKPVCDDEEEEYFICVTNNYTNDILDDSFLHFAYLNTMNSDYKLSMDLEIILEATYTGEVSNKDLENVNNDPKNLIN